jgi:hypothetical protein
LGIRVADSAHAFKPSLATADLLTMAFSRTDPFYDPKCRLRRARQHLSNLKDEITRFLRDDPCEVVRERDPEGIYEIWKIKLKRIPSLCDDLAFETLFTLRAALDQVAYAAAVVSGKQQPRANFPIANTPEWLDGMLCSPKCRDLPDEIKALFRTFKPYETGNDVIWKLNRLRNSVHTSLAPVGVTGARFKVPFDRPEPGAVARVEGDIRWDRLENEIILRQKSHGRKSDHNMSVTPVIGFDHGDITRGEPAITFLNAASREVKHVVKLTEETCRRLFIK